LADGGVAISLKRWLLAIAGAALAAASLFALYRWVDPERADLDDRVRAAVPGNFVRLSHGYTHYELGGPSGGRVLVLACGFSVPYYIWDPTFGALTGAGFRVLRYDYYGRGYSDRPVAAYTDEFYVRQLKELLDALHLGGPLDLVGLSMGAGIVTAFADAYPDRVRSLIYFDPSFRSKWAVSWLERHPRAWDFVTTLIDEPGWARSQLDDFEHPERFADWPEKYRVQMQYRGFRRARLSEIVSNADIDQAPQLQRVAAHPRPILLIWGARDRTVPFEEKEALMQVIPQATLVPVEDAGHLPQLEQPPAVNAALIAFLRKP
jgi:pimeloyl-ACP methyl ester carboxylesterase